MGDGSPGATVPPRGTGLVRLGRAGPAMAPLALGTWSWGDRGDWGFGRTHDAGDLREAVRAAVASGPILFDTAERYGGGEAERYLGRFLREEGRPALVATKFSPARWQLTRGDLLRALRASLARLGLPCVDLYQVHWPVRLCPVERRAAALADAVDAGLARAVGVSNHSLDQVLRTERVLAARGVPLAAVQVELSLLQRSPAASGLLEACLERGITLLAYSPLAMGVLSGKYGPGRPAPAGRGVRYPEPFLARLAPLLGLLAEIGAAHGGKTAAQVALAWVRCLGAVPIAGVKNRAQVEEALGSLGWDLSPGEARALEAAAERAGPPPGG